MLASASPAAAQGDLDDIFLSPQLALPQLIGIDGGYTQWSYDGEFYVSDRTLPCATFTTGDGGGPDVGVRALFYINTWLFASPRVRLESRNGRFVAPLAGEPARDASNNQTTLEQEAQADVALSSLTLDLRIGAEFAETGLYVAAGAAAGMLIGGTYDYSERLLAPSGFVYARTRSTEQQLASDRALDNKEAFVVEARGGVGYILFLGTIALNPEVYYSLPLTSALASPERLTASGFGGSIGILFNFGQ